MSKIDIVRRITGKSGEKKAVVARVLQALTEVVAEGLVSTGKAQIPGVAHLTKVTRAPRIRRNPRTGEVFGLTDPKVSVKFKPLKSLTDTL